MNNKLILFLLLLILIVPTISAVPPFLAGDTATSGIDIVFPILDGVMRERVNTTLYFHLLNKSNGFAFDNTSMDCLIDIYNEAGGEIFKENITEFAPPYDFLIVLNESVFTLTGSFDYFIYCNDTNAGLFGWTEVGSEVTQSGRAIPTNSLFTIIIVSIVIILFFLTFTFVFEHNGVKVFGVIGAIIQIIYMVFILFAYQSGDNLISLLKMNFWIMLILGFGIIMIVGIMYVVSLINQEVNQEGIEKPKWRK